MVLIDGALVVLALTLLVAIGRLLVGPTDADRGLAVDLGFVVVVAAVGLLAVRLDTPALFDLVVVATLVGFLTIVALARLIRGRSS